MLSLKSSRVLAMDIGASELKLAAFACGRKSIELTHVAVRPFGIESGSEAPPGEKITETIRATLVETGIHPCPVVLSVTGQSAFMRSVKLPPVKPARVYQTVLYEAQQNVPFPIEEVVWDYQLMGSSRVELNVMLVAIKKEIIESVTDCVQAAGLDVELVDVAPMALYNAVRYNYGELGGCTLVIDIGARATNLVFIEAGRFYSRNLPIVGTGNAITQQLMKEFNLSHKEAEELKRMHASVAFGGAYEDFADKVVSKVSKTVRSAMTRLHVEVERSINFYKTQQGGEQPTHVLLAGGTSVIARTDEFFKEKLKLDVEYLNPFKNVPVHEAITVEEIGACAHVMGEVVGVGLRHALPCPLEVNLLPPRMVAEKTFRRRQPFFIATAAGLVLTALCWWAFFARMGALASERKNKVAEQVGRLEAVEGRLRAIVEHNKALWSKTQELTALVRQRPRWLEVFGALQDCMPEGMWLVSVAPLTKASALPEAGKGGGGPRSPAAPPSAVKGRVPYTHLLIKGWIFADKATDKSVPHFQEQLARSPCFTKDTGIVSMPMPDQNDYAREFVMEVALKEPL